MIYDYAFIGAGAAGLHLIEALRADAYFDEKRILIIEKAAKESNDRTWCFWEIGEGPQEAYLDKTWSQVEIGIPQQRMTADIKPYTYKMMRSKGFYQAMQARHEIDVRVTRIQDEVLEANEKGEAVLLTGRKDIYKAKQVFDSRFDYKQLLDQSDYPVLQQHFLGWFIRTETPVFHADRATFMDFQIPQKGNTRFMYVLPLSETEALLEYTLFSGTPLSMDEYEQGIREYIQDHLQIEKYQVVEKERGNIPMTCYPFWEKASEKIIPIGIAGGWAKASTGYTFKKSERKAKQLARFLKTNRPLNRFGGLDRFWFYDLLLLDILDRKNELGSQVFGVLFKRQDPQLIFKFLDEQTNFWEEVRIMASSDVWLFLDSLLRNLNRTIHQVFSKSS